MGRGSFKGGLLVSVAGLVLLSGCMDQYNPRRYWAQFKQEREIAHRELPKLTEKGELPAPPVADVPETATVGEPGSQVAAAGSVNPVKAKFDALCAACHGPDGKADGATAQALNPKPRNFHDKAWQAKVDDAHIKNVIQNGGGAVGLSPTMPGMGPMLNDAELNGIVAMIRDWGK